MGTLVLEKGPGVRRALLVGMLVAVPALFLRMLNDPFNVPKLALLILGVTIVGAIRIAEMLQGGAGVGASRAYLVPAVAIVIPLLAAWMFSQYRAWAVFGEYGRFQGLLPYFVVLAFGLLVADAFQGRLTLLAWGFVGGGAVVAAYAVVQWLGADPFNWVSADVELENVSLSTLGNSNFSGGYLGIVFPICLVLAADARTRVRGIQVGLLLLAGLLATNSQGGWVAAAAGGVTTAGFLIAGRFPGARRWGLLAAAAVLVGVVGVVGFTIVKTDSALTSEYVVWRGRWWQAATSMGLESPIVGRGPNTFAIEGIGHRTVEDAMRLNYRFADDPHSVFFSFVSTAGILGAAGFLFLLGWTIRSGWSLWGADLWAAGFLGAAMAYFVQSAVSIDELTLRAGFWCAVGGLVAARNTPQEMPVSRAAQRRKQMKRRKRPAREPLRAVPALAVLVLGALFVSWWAGRFVLSDGRVRAGLVLFEAGDPEAATSEFRRALAFRADDRYRQLFASRLATVSLGADPGAQDVAGYFERAEDNYLALRERGRLADAVEYARLLHRWAEFDPAKDAESIAEYRRAIRLDPLNPLIRVELADVLSAQEEPEGALAVLEELEPLMLDINTANAQFWGAVAETRARLGEIDGARAAVDRALALDPNDGRALTAVTLIDQAGAS
ncbi:MAG: O-antigen ligase family protein [Actinomycetota bacterium]